MALMPGCKMIHYKFFDRKDVLKLKRPTLKVSHAICCDILKPESLARDLKIDEKCLPALSILCGNDFTGIFNEKYDIQKKLGFEYPFISNIAVWIKHHEKDCMLADIFTKIKQIEDICEEYPEYHEAILYSYDFYQSDKHDSKHLWRIRPKSPLHDLVTKEVQNHEMSREFLAITKTGVVWRNEIEQLDHRMDCIHKMLQPVRILIYRLLCIRDIIEYGQVEVNRFEKQIICIHPYGESSIHSLRRLPFDIKPLLVFNALLNCPSTTYKSITSEMFWVETVHIQKHEISDMVRYCGETEDYLHATLTCACLLFAIKNRVIFDRIFITPMLLACFCCALDIVPPKLAARPGPTGVTIASQFMVILQHARWVASLSGLHDQLPLPSIIFQPFVYIPLHGTAFKIAIKEKFHGEDTILKEFYTNVCSGREFMKFQDLIKQLAHDIPDDIFPTIISQYINTKRDIQSRLSKVKSKATKKK